jgi:GTP-binding protein
MRREGYEFMVGRPKVLYKMEGNQKMEPIEHLFVDVAEEYQGVVVDKL